MIFLFDELLYLAGECNIGKEESCVLLIVTVFGSILISGVNKDSTFEDRFQSQSPF